MESSVPIKILGEQIYNGFLLSEAFTHKGDLIVLTGKNGSGKTRLIESIQKQMSKVELDGEILTNQEIMVVAQSTLNPNFGGAYNDAQYQTKITSSLQLFDQVKREFDSPLDINGARNRGRLLEGSIPYESLYRLCVSIAGYLNKPASELSHEEIKMYFEDHVNSVLGFQNVSGICNSYIKRKKLNRFNKYCAEQEGDDVIFLTEDEFLSKFGDKPWLLLNQIVKATFNGKFYFTEPDESSESYSYNASLIQSDTGSVIGINALSSGENTLLWLALTLFNSQYYDKAIVKTPKILLLDEPDAFLHPQMVVKMYQALNSFAMNFKVQILITTHSPTTVALAPENSTYVVSENAVFAVTKDKGVAELLDGVTQISINPENRRQVYVESQYDADVYQAIYSALLRRSELLDSKISLNFISSGPKMPSQQLKDKAKQILEVIDEKLLDEFVESVNGIGNCTQVTGQVEALEQIGNKTVRGVIDWDLKNSSLQSVSVLAEQYAYSIENITLDPICILLMLHTDRPASLTMKEVCGKDVHWTEWLDDDSLLQESVDRFIKKILGRESNKDKGIEYVSGKILLTDSEYLHMNGHALEKLVKEKFNALNAFVRSGKDGELKYSIVNKSMINMTNGKFIPSVFEKVLAMVQK
jgi:ABC-type multidrug transport system ATPase subunit